MKKRSDEGWTLIKSMFMFIIGIFVDLSRLQPPEEYPGPVLLNQ
jgi:hypothetical protein